MKKHLSILLLCSLFTAICLLACKNKVSMNVGAGAYADFPEEVGKILVNRCATAGCHNEATRSAGLLLDSWEHMLEGGFNGAAVIAYSPEHSPLLFFTNTNPDLGTALSPTMPPVDAGVALSKEEYLILRDWIANGAPNKNGEIPFAKDAETRQKIYLTMQACDLVGVIDAQSKVVMRYIKVGGAEIKQNKPHCIRVSPDGKYAYVCFTDSKYVQKINTTTDKIEQQLYPLSDNNTGYNWNVLYITPNSKEVLISNWINGGFVAWLDAQSMLENLPIPFSMSYPHGITSNATGDTFFVTAEMYNAVYKIVPERPGRAAFFDTISIVKGQKPDLSNTTGTPQPHEAMMTPDYSKYFLSCQGSNEVRVMDAHTDTLIAVIPVATLPKEIAMSKKQPYAFITCQGAEGAVEVINYKTLQKVTTIRSDKFRKPHGIAVDDRNGLIYVASTNENGPPSHHPSQACGGGTNGFYQVFDLNTFQPVNNRSYEVSPFPYSADVRFKD